MITSQWTSPTGHQRLLPPNVNRRPETHCEVFRKVSWVMALVRENGLVIAQPNPAKESLADEWQLNTEERSTLKFGTCAQIVLIGQRNTTYP